MKLSTLFVFGALPATALFVHLHAFPAVHVDVFHAHLRALHDWLMPGSASEAPRGAPAPEAAHPVIGYDLARTGIDWHRGLDSVLGGTQPILLFQLLGEFDQVHC